MLLDAGGAGEVNKIKLCEWIRYNISIRFLGVEEITSLCEKQLYTYVSFFI